jgi:TetR/AcrR family transcriptional repressor of mexJK operon
VSKGTLYNHFPDKESLFVACVQMGASEVHDQLSVALVGSHTNIEASLTALGTRFLEIMSASECITFVRMLEAEVGRQPKIGQLLYSTGYKVAAERVAEYLDRACKKGQLDIDDPLRAAQQFFALCRAEVDVALRMGMMEQISPEQARVHIQHAVRVFLKAYAAQVSA